MSLNATMYYIQVRAKKKDHGISGLWSYLLDLLGDHEPLIDEPDFISFSKVKKKDRGWYVIMTNDKPLAEYIATECRESGFKVTSSGPPSVD